MSRKPWLLTAALLLMSAFAGAACNTITVADTLYDENGNLLNGTVTIVNSSTITGADGCVVPAFTSKKVTVTNGVLSVALVPNNGSTPSGTSYTVEYHVSSKYFTETWVVPASGPQTLSGVRALTPPVPTAMIAASQLNPPSPCTSSQVMTWNGTNWTCASAAGSVASVFGRTGTVTAQGGDYTAAQVTNAESTANKNAASGYAGLDSGSRIVKAQAPSATVYTDQANTYTAGMKQVFGASATTAGEGFGGVVADPSGAVAGDRWYRTDLNCMRIFTSAAHCVMFSDGSIAIGQTPLTTRGDLMTVNSGGALARLGIGSATQALFGGTDPAWAALTLASSQFANQGTVNQVLHGNAAGNPSWSAVAIGDVTGSSGTGNFLFGTSPTMTNATVNQAADGNNLLFGQRFTDSSPTGNLIYFKNAANNADLFKLDVAGVMTHSNNVLFATDNSFDLGASASGRPRTGFFGTSVVVPNGLVTAPSVGIGGAGQGLFWTGSVLGVAIGNGSWAAFQSTAPGGVAVWGGAGYCFTSTGNSTDACDTVTMRNGAARSVRIGFANSASPQANLFTVGENSRPGSDSNVAGSDGTIQPGNGTGTGGSGILHIRTAPTASTGTSANTYGDVLTISRDQHVKFASNAAPSITAGCGTSPSVTGSDNVMQVNVGTGGVATSCTVTFAKAYTAAPLCFANDEGRNTPLTRAVGSTTTVVIDTSSAWAASSKIDVACYGN